MKTLHVVALGTATALAAGANAAILVLDHFEEGSPLGIYNAVQTLSLDAEWALGPFYRVVTLEMQSISGGDAALNWSVLGSYGNFYSSESANGKVTIKYGLPDANDPSNLLPMNLDRSYYGLKGGVGVYMLDYSADAAVDLTVTIVSNSEGTPKNWVWSQTLALSYPELIIDGDQYTSLDPGFDLADIDFVTFEFDVPQAGDFKVDALGIPEPHEYAAVATLGLLGFAAFRRLHRRS